MKDLRTAAKAALKYIEWHLGYSDEDPEQTPHDTYENLMRALSDEEPQVDGWPLWSCLPPPAVRKPLTDGQINAIVQKLNERLTGFRGWTFLDVARAVERAHGIGAAKEPT
jgi:hypothetical protein